MFSVLTVGRLRAQGKGRHVADRLARVQECPLPGWHKCSHSELSPLTPSKGFCCFADGFLHCALLALQTSRAHSCWTFTRCFLFLKGSSFISTLRSCVHGPLSTITPRRSLPHLDSLIITASCFISFVVLDPHRKLKPVIFFMDSSCAVSQPYSNRPSMKSGLLLSLR